MQVHSAQRQDLCTKGRQEASCIQLTFAGLAGKRCRML